MKIYIYVFAVAVVLGAYWAGIRLGMARARTQCVQNNNTLQTVFLHKKENINAETVRTSVRDIRRILHEKYTIAD